MAQVGDGTQALSDSDVKMTVSARKTSKETIELKKFILQHFVIPTQSLKKKMATTHLHPVPELCVFALGEEGGAVLGGGGERNLSEAPENKNKNSILILV